MATASSYRLPRSTPPTIPTGIGAIPRKMDTSIIGNGWSLPSSSQPVKTPPGADSTSDPDIIAIYPLQAQLEDRTNLRQGQMVFINKNELARNDANLANYDVRNLADLNRGLKLGFARAQHQIDRILNPNSGVSLTPQDRLRRDQLRDLLYNTNERHWNGHSFFSNRMDYDPAHEIQRYMTLDSIMTEWRFLGNYLVDSDQYKYQGNLLTGKNMVITVLLAGDETMEDLWGEKAVQNSGLYFIVKRKYDMERKAYGAFQVFPYASVNDAYGIIPNSAYQYEDDSKTKQYGAIIEVGMLIDVPKGHTDERSRLIEAGLLNPTGTLTMAENYRNVKKIRIALSKNYFPTTSRVINA